MCLANYSLKEVICYLRTLRQVNDTLRSVSQEEVLLEPGVGQRGTEGTENVQRSCIQVTDCGAGAEVGTVLG